MKNKDNRGLTLVELLVAIVILAIVLIPISHSFVSSYTINVKSRQTLRATTLAQNEMEIFEKDKISSLIENPMYADCYEINNPTDGSYTFRRENVVNGTTDQAKFDVTITLEPKPFNAVYEKDYITLNTLSALDSGRFVQTVPLKDNKESMDVAAYKELLKSFPGKTMEEIERETVRTITLNIYEIEKDEKKFLQAKVQTEYKLDTVTYKGYDRVIFTNAESKDEDGNVIPLRSVYLFYAPRYKALTSDLIQINNDANSKTDIYIIRQDIYNADFTAIEPVPTTYKEKMIIKDGIPSARYFTNLNIDGSAESASKGLAFDLSFNGANCNTGDARENAIKSMQFNDLTVKSEKNRLYDVTVKVFSAGANQETETPLASLTGTKLE